MKKKKSYNETPLKIGETEKNGKSTYQITTGIAARDRRGARKEFEETNITG